MTVEDDRQRHRRVAGDAPLQPDACLSYLNGICKPSISLRIAAVPISGSSPTDDGARHLRIPAGASDRARTRSIHGVGELRAEARQDGDAVIVVVAGEFDLPAADPVRQELTRALSAPRQRLILDLSEVTFIDVSGLHVVLDAYKRCLESETTLTIRPGPANVQRVFELTNLVEYLPFEGGE